MCTRFPYWDISYLVAVIFTLGSCVWVINAFFVWLPLVKPGTEFHNEILVAGGVSAFIGATVFEIGSVLLVIEAVNENREGCFGWALERVVSRDDDDGEKEEEEGKVRVRPDTSGCRHHHSNKKNVVDKPSVAEHSSAPYTSGSSSTPSPSSSPSSSPRTTQKQGDPDRAWQWFPSRHDLTHHYLHEPGFLASLAQLLGATVFWISGVTALPGINDKLSHRRQGDGLLDGIYWTPQIIGGVGFLISGALFMLETQRAWWKPAWGNLGWHVGLWNLVGAVGFTLCGALGIAATAASGNNNSGSSSSSSSGDSGVEYQASLATFWGSWAFLLASVVQWYESLDKHPVET